MISLAHASASTALMPDGWGRTQSSRFSGELSSRIPFLWWTLSSANSIRPSLASITRMCSKTYPWVRALGWSGIRTMRYPAWCLVRPPFQLWFADPAWPPRNQQAQHELALTCFGSPHAHWSRDRQAGQSWCRLDGRNPRPHVLHVRMRTMIAPIPRPRLWPLSRSNRPSSAVQGLRSSWRLASTYGGLRDPRLAARPV